MKQFYLDQREDLNDEVAAFINKPEGISLGSIAAKQQAKTMTQTNLFKPSPDHIGGMGADKSRQHGWKPIPNVEYELCHIDKNKLYVDHGVQRSDVSEINVNYIAANWNWACVGSLVVGLRPNGNYVVVEGQHRLLASMKRREIVTLPCILIQFKDQRHEAETFLAINTCRKAVSALDKHRVGAVAENTDILLVNKVLDRVGIRLVKNPIGSRQTKAISVIKSILVDKGEEVTSLILSTLREVEWERGVPASTVKVMAYLHKNLDGGINSRFIARLIALGGTAILKAERAGGALSSTPGIQYPARGLIIALNKSVPARNHFRLTGLEK